MIIRSYQQVDEPAVINLWQKTGLIKPWNHPVKDIKRKLNVQPQWFMVAQDKAKVIATVMAGYDGHRGWINYLAVDPDHQGSGVGRQLMEHVEQLLTDFGCPKINLQIRKTNKEVMAFYKAIGFVEDDVVSYGKRLIPD